jgi:hypothetical protein
MVLCVRPIQFLLLTNQNNFDLIADRRQNALFDTFSQTQKKNILESGVKRHITLETRPFAFYVVGTR